MLTQPVKQLRRLIASPARRLVRARPGSVLILVVALLVLLALMGTAYISSARIERTTAHAHAADTQVDLLMEGIINSIKGAATTDLIDESSGKYRGASSLTQNLATGSSGTYAGYTSEFRQTWLASRIPGMRDDAAFYGGDPANRTTGVAATRIGANLAGWSGISWPLLLSSNQNIQFEDPTGGNTSKVSFLLAEPYNTARLYSVGDIVTVGSQSPTYWRLPTGSNINPGLPGTLPLPANAWVQIDPKVFRRYEPSYKAFNGGIYPAFSIYDPSVGPGGEYVALPTIDRTGLVRTPSVTGPNPTYYLAADADGDGVADSVFWKFPIGEIDGITYYAASRVIDNAAAINVNTAFSMTADLDAAGAALVSGGVNINPSLFPSNVGLLELFSTAPPTTMNGLLQYIYRHASFSNPPVSPPWPHDSIGAPVSDPNPQTGLYRANGDFIFMTQGDEAYHQLARRLDNPGQTSIGGAAGSQKFQAFPIADTINIASRFCLRSSGGGPYGLLEPLVPEMSYHPPPPLPATTIPSLAWEPTQTGSVGAAGSHGWFEFNFLDGGGQNAPRRSMLVTRNGVSERGPELAAPTGLPVPVILPAGTRIEDVINPGMLPYDPPVATAGDTVTNYAPGNFVKFKRTVAPFHWGVYRCLQTTTTALNPPDAADIAVPVAPNYNNAIYHQSAFWSKESWTPSVTRTSINTATFPELWRSFYNVMADQWNIAANTVDASTSPPTVPAVPRPGKSMFKNVIRTRSALPGAPLPLSDTQVAQLRSAIAAVNAMDLRDVNNDITSRKIVLLDDPSGGALQRAPVSVTVHGSEKQLFITKVFVHADAPNNDYYVAIELYNPYVSSQYGGTPGSPGPSIYIGAKPVGAPATDVGLGLTLGRIDRATAVPTLVQIPTVAERALIDAAPAIPPGGRVVLASAAAVPPGAGPGITVPAPIVIAGLADFVAGGRVAGGAAAGVPGELVLFRTHLSTGAPSVASAASVPPVNDPEQQYDEGVNFQDNVPMDQFDMTGATAVAPPATDFVYERPSGPGTALPPAPVASPALGAATAFWKCVYPIAPAATYACQAAPLPATGGGEVPIATPVGTGVMGFGAENPLITAAMWHQIQINNTDWPAPHLDGLTPANRIYPYGGFGRNGDILMTPFIGSYVITEIGALAGVVDEINTVSMDALLAEDSDDTAGLVPPKRVYDDPGVAPDIAPAAGIPSREQVGRFCPLTAAPHANWPVWPAGQSETINPYVWTNRIFDYFTVQAPHDDYLPNVNPADFLTAANNPGIGVIAGLATAPDAVANGTHAANDGDDAVPIQGQVNINTASWRVLSMLPLVRAPNGAVDTVTTALLAKAIVYYRDVDDGTGPAGQLHPHGPFKSIFELNQVEDYAPPAVAVPPIGFPGFQNSYGTINTQYAGRLDDPDGRQGELTPNDTRLATRYPLFSTTAGAYGPTDAVSGDFKEKFLALARISNLITTRSDSFTCYVLVQGWRGVGTASATLAVQKRGAFILDRSSVGYTLDANGKRTLNLTPDILRVSSN